MKLIPNKTIILFLFFRLNNNKTVPMSMKIAATMSSLICICVLFIYRYYTMKKGALRLEANILSLGDKLKKERF